MIMLYGAIGLILIFVSIEAYKGLMGRKRKHPKYFWKKHKHKDVMWGSTKKGKIEWKKKRKNMLD